MSSTKRLAERVLATTAKRAKSGCPVLSTRALPTRALEEKARASGRERVCGTDEVWEKHFFLPLVTNTLSLKGW